MGLEKEKVIVYISHNRYREDIVKVYKYSDENVEKEMKERWGGEDGHEGYFGDLPSENGHQYGWVKIITIHIPLWKLKRFSMELKNLNNLKDEIAYLEEAEELLRAIWLCFDVYELEIKMAENLIGTDTINKLRSHFDFDDSE